MAKQTNGVTQVVQKLGAEKKGLEIVAVTKSAGEFTFDEVVQVFGLNYTINFYNMEQYTWEIKDLDLDFTMTQNPCLMLLLENYGKNSDRSSIAVCRVALNLILNECLTVLKGNHAAETSSNHQQKPPTPFDDLRIYGEVAFNYVVSEDPSTYLRSLSISGRLDYGIGRVIYRWPGRRFQCSLIITATARFSTSLGVPQLLAYLACLRQSRLERKRTDASVYGVASDGYQFTFITIMHDGTVKISDELDILRGQLLQVLGWLKFILEKAVMSPCGDENDGKDFDDPPIDLDDNDYESDST